MDILGVDIGGSGIKGAVVDTLTGELKTERIRIPTPQPATPKAVAETLKQLVDQIGFKGPIGCGFPARVNATVMSCKQDIWAYKKDDHKSFLIYSRLHNFIF